MADVTEYKCEVCGGQFTKGWSDAEAQAEYEREFPVDAANGEATGLACDACYRAMRKAIELAEGLKAQGLCGEIAAWCICAMDGGHPVDVTTPHVCPCGGIWTGSIEGDDFQALALPMVLPLAAMLGQMLPPTSHDVRMN